MQEITDAVRNLLGENGFAAFSSREMTEGMLKRLFPEKKEAVAACCRVLFLPRYLMCLEWLAYEPHMAERRQQLWSYYAHLIGTLPEEHLQEKMLTCNTQLMLHSK